MLATQPASSLFHPPQALRLDDAWRPLAEAMHEFEERALAWVLRSELLAFLMF